LRLLARLDGAEYRAGDEMAARRLGALAVREARTQGAPISMDIGATEDAASRRPVRRGDLVLRLVAGPVTGWEED
jgi:hypothetical protein